MSEADEAYVTTVDAQEISAEHARKICLRCE